jgi:S-adenosylmethionine synthetase
MHPEFVFTSESVTRGHPDKLCDRISDAVVGGYLRQDPRARVIAECAVSTGVVFLSVKFNSAASVNVIETARDVIGEVGYQDDGFNARSCTVLTSLLELPALRRSEGETRDLDEAALDAITAQDQATLFGFACRQTPALMPLPIWLAHKLARQLDRARESKKLPYLAPDGKVQVAVEFRSHRPFRIHGVTLVASQHRGAQVNSRRLKDDLIECVLRPAFADEPIGLDDRTRIAVNPEGPLVPGGPELHAGLTGRKTAVDTYGEFARHSGAALSGKDPERIDRIGAYAARYAAKNVVFAGLAEQCEVQLSYSIGTAAPVSVNVETSGSATVPEAEIIARLRRSFDFRPEAIVRSFGLCTLPRDQDGDFYRALSAYGHVGRLDLKLPWEATDRAAALRD